MKRTDFATRIIMGMGIPKVLVQLNMFILQKLQKKGMYRTRAETGWYKAPKT